jgi:hypothetical protein
MGLTAIDVKSVRSLRLVGEQYGKRHSGGTKKGPGRSGALRCGGFGNFSTVRREKAESQSEHWVSRPPGRRRWTQRERKQTTTSQARSLLGREAGRPGHRRRSTRKCVRIYRTTFIAASHSPEFSSASRGRRGTVDYHLLDRCRAGYRSSKSQD